MSDAGAVPPPDPARTERWVSRRGSVRSHEKNGGHVSRCGSSLWAPSCGEGTSNIAMSGQTSRWFGSLSPSGCLARNVARDLGLVAGCGSSKHGRSAAIDTPKGRSEVAVTRESERQGQSRQVAAVRKVDKGSREPELGEVAVQRDALEATKQVRQVRRRDPRRLGDVVEPQGLDKMRVQEFLRPAKESARRDAGRCDRARGLEGVLEQVHHRLFKVEVVDEASHRLVAEAGKGELQPGVCSPAALSKQWMPRERLMAGRLVPGTAWRDDEFSVRMWVTLSDPKRLSPLHEEHLVGVAHHLVTCDVPDEYAVIGQADLERRRIILRCMTPWYACRPQVFHQRDARAEQHRSRRRDRIRVQRSFAVELVASL